MTRRENRRIAELETRCEKQEAELLELWKTVNETREYLIETRRALLEVMGIPPEAVPMRPRPPSLHTEFSSLNDDFTAGQINRPHPMT
jgi:hypothetical protein